VCRVHYSGRLFDGERPYFTTFTHGHTIRVSTTDEHLVPGAVEALRLMAEGDEWEIIVPSELAYGDSSPGGVRVRSRLADQWCPYDVLRPA
jgi:FKBP-type peptidyl-prolyl cis-trans isomerase FklB